MVLPPTGAIYVSPARVVEFIVPATTVWYSRVLAKCAASTLIVKFIAPAPAVSHFPCHTFRLRQQCTLHQLLLFSSPCRTQFELRRLPLIRAILRRDSIHSPSTEICGTDRLRGRPTAAECNQTFDTPQSAVTYRRKRSDGHRQ